MTTADTAPLGLEAPVGNPRFTHLDALRALAALSVFAYHAAVVRHFPRVVQRLSGHGDFGVVLFFLISGFLLYRPFVTARSGRAPNIDVTRFYIARLLRIVPAYWLALTAIAIWPGVARFHDRWWQLYLFGQIYDPRTALGAGLGPAWSLCVEVSFYLVLPAYALVAARLVRPIRSGQGQAIAEVGVLAGLALVSIVVHVLIVHSPANANLSFTLPATFYLFAVGMALAVLSTEPIFESTLARMRYRPEASWALAFLLFVAISLLFSSKATGSVNPVYVPVALFILLPAVTRTGGIPGRVMEWRWLARLGAVSYAFYLWHQTVLVEVGRHTRSPLVLVILSLAMTTAIAVLSYRVLERPFLRLKARIRTPDRSHAR